MVKDINPILLYKILFQMRFKIFIVEVTYIRW